MLGRQSRIGIGKDLNNLNWEDYDSVTFSAKNSTYDFYSVDYKGNTIFIKNTLTNPYHNGFVEGNNNFIKVIKRIAFGFRSFHRFKARIMICKNLLHVKRVNAI